MTYDTLRRKADTRFDGQHVGGLRQLAYSALHLIESMIRGTVPHGIVVRKDRVGVMVPRRDTLVETGQVLRSARLARGMTLRDVGTASRGRFKPTAVAGYERADRSISVERFCDLCQVYDMAPERLLSLIMWRRGGGHEPVIDLRRIDELPRAERDAVSAFVDQVRRMRMGQDEGAIRLRVRDLEVLATLSGHKLDEFIDYLRPVLI